MVEAGRFEAAKVPSAEHGGAASGPAVRVATYEGCGSFGEMALMYNCPRAASVTGEPCLVDESARARFVGDELPRAARLQAAERVTVAACLCKHSTCANAPGVLPASPTTSRPAAATPRTNVPSSHTPAASLPPQP